MTELDVERNPMSSPTEFEDFMESTVWQDMSHEIHIWLDGARDGLESPTADEKELYRNQGRADACRRFLSLPEVMRDSLLTDRELKRKPSKDDGFRGDIIQEPLKEGE